jgi:hypothetical protein
LIFGLSIDWALTLIGIMSMIQQQLQARLV